MHYLIAIIFLLFSNVPALAEEISPENLVGQYKVEAKAGFQKVYLNFRVLNTRDFEIQRTYPDGHADETCNGTYVLGVSKIFKGVFTCPSNRSKDIDFNVHLQNKKTEDLVQGTNVTVTTSMAPGMRINAYLKRE